MTSSSTPFRSTGLTAAATTVVALMAVVACAAASQAGPLGVLEGRVATEHRPVRVVAAAMAAVARDFMGSERTTATIHGSWSSSVSEPMSSGSIPATTDDALPPRRVLAERLLDLPPPLI